MPYVFNPFSGTFDWTVTGVPTLTSGGVTFGSSTGTITQDSTNFNYNDATDTLALSSSSSERITNGTFTGSAAGWTLGAGWTYSSNSVAHTANGTAALYQYPTISNGDRFEVSFVISNLTAGSVTVIFGGVVLGSISTNGTYTYRVVPTNGAQGIAFNPSNTARFTVDNVSAKILTGGSIQAGSAYIQGDGLGGVVTVAGNKSNGSPGTTRHASFENNGAYTWLDFKFSGTDRAHIGASSSGDLSLWSGGGNYVGFYNKSTNALFSYNTPAVFGHYGSGLFGGSVHAGGAYNPQSTLQSAGSTALKVKYITTNMTLDNTATKWIVDPTTPVCTGTPSNACSSYSNETDCLNRDAHGGCTWFSGYNCSMYNSDQYNCENTSGCTYESASCSAFGDESTCNSYSGCSWTNNPQSCAGLDEGTCSATSGCSANYAGCTINYDYCSNYNNDQTGCDNANGGGFCSYDTGTGDCSGGYWYVSCSGGGSCTSQPDEYSCSTYTYFDNCSGSYDSYSCTGSYYTGTCSGTFGAACSGTATCGGIDDSTNCNGETGCSWQTAITLTLPEISLCIDRDYWIYNVSSSNADVVIVPSDGDQINHTTSYTLPNFKDWVHISPYRKIANCNGLSESVCNATSGCTAYSNNCVWDSGSMTCTGDASCASYGDESSCNSATYYGGCYGNYVESDNWYVFGK